LAVCPLRTCCTIRGHCHLRCPDGAMVLRAGQFLDLPLAVDMWAVAEVIDAAALLRVAGRRGEDIAGCGIWNLQNEEGATHAGDAVDDPKRTRIDAHYHNYDEYWYVLDGAATAVVSAAWPK
jgi:hypothetical protein